MLGEAPGALFSVVFMIKRTSQMPIDYKAIRQDPEEAAKIAVRRLMQLYSEKVHFVYEFLQNADDAGARDEDEKGVGLAFILRQEEGDMLVWNDGRPFTSEFKCMSNARQVALSAEINSQEIPREEEDWLVFSKAVAPPTEVVDKLRDEADDEREKERILKSAQLKQPIEVGFRWQDGRIVPAERCVLFAYLPTEKETHLRFLIQARYQTTPARDNISLESAWNCWLIQETADFLPYVLEQLKRAHELTPSFFDILPLPKDSVPDVFQPIIASLDKALREGAFIPTQNGNYARPEQVF